jgi:tRNA pseudouridine-54 N-methylase
VYHLFKQAVYQINPELTKQEWRYVESCCQVKAFQKKAFFIDKGDIQEAIGFVDTGLIRAYYLNEKGEEDDVPVPVERHTTIVIGGHISPLEDLESLLSKSPQYSFL